MNTTLAAESSNEDLIRRLTAHQTYAWPTLWLFAAIVVAAGLATAFALRGELSMLAALAINTVCSYAAYSVLHEASHGLISTRRGLNDAIGRIGLFMVSITPFFRTYRFLHMTHHRFTNDPKKDPDHFAGNGSPWLLPLRWMVMDTAYVWTYFKGGFYETRPRAEKLDFWLSIAFAAAALTLVAVMDWWYPFLMLYFIPTRIALFVLAITFDYLPHFPYGATAESDKYRATNNRIGLEWLLTPLLIGHNYHLSHHLNPTVPFYRYRRLWDATKHLHAAHDPATVRYYKLHPDPVTERKSSVPDPETGASPQARTDRQGA